MHPDLGLNPWISIWTEPRKTIRTLVDHAPRRALAFLYALYGFPTALGLAQSLNFGAVFPLPAIFLIALVACVPIGWIAIAILATLFRWTGQWIGGGASFFEVRAAVAWACVPNLVLVLCWFALAYLFGADAFGPQMAHAAQMLPQTQQYQAMLVFLAQVVFSVWGFILLLKTLGEVQRFSAWKALLNVGIVFFLCVVAAWVLVFLSTMVAAWLQ